MIITIKLKNEEKPYRFTDVFKINENNLGISVWFNGQWNTPRIWKKDDIDGPIVVEF